jgi:hypothetical protein
MRIRLRTGAVLSAAALLAMPFVVVQACGPDFAPDTFVRTTIPDDFHAFGAGHLGILQTGYDSNELAVAYRYLNGGVLSKDEQQQYAPPPEPVKDWTKMSPQQIEDARAAEDAAQPVGQWLAARNGFVTPIAPVDAKAAGLPDPQGWNGFDAPNCPDAAFQTAVLTLKHRAGAWGKQSPWVADWIHAQDAVFANCSGEKSGTPGAAPQGAPALLRADRAYQAAAALFYARKYDEAREAFEAIARDDGSPWHAWGEYLAARATVRKAFAMGKPSEEFNPDLAQFDMPTMKQAQQMLETLLAHPPESLSREAVQSELNFVRIRTEPDKRAAEICAALAGPRTDPRLKQDLDDLNFLLVKQVKLASAPPLLEWIDAVRHGSGDKSLERWKETQTTPWLVTAMMQADAKSPGTAELMTAAAKVQPADPAYDTVAFHRVRLLTERGRGEDARALADQMLQSKRKAQSSDRNAFLGERMKLARSFDEFLEYAPRMVLDANSPGFFAAGGLCSDVPDPKNRPRDCMQDEHALAFDDDAVDVLNRQTPLSRMVEAARSEKLPKELRDEVAMAAWTRSVLLDDVDNAAKLAPLIPERLRKIAGASIGFPATLAILRSPGLRPVLEPGFSRFRSYDSLDDFRNNWWCGGWQSQSPKSEGDTPRKPEKIPYLSDEEQARGQAESTRMMELPCAPTYLGRRTIEYAKAHPDDPDVPEALHLTVRATRYACLTWGSVSEGDAGKENSATSKAAFQLLHAKYPKSPWTAKTKYYY